MPYQLRAPKDSGHTKRQASPDYGINSGINRGAPYLRIKFFLEDSTTGHGQYFSFSAPPQLPIKTARQIRDTILIAINKGMIKSVKSWNTMCDQINLHLATLP